jgi:phosphonate dehydrogenase
VTERPRVVVTHWIHQEAAEHLGGFCHPVIPGSGVLSRERCVELTTDAEALIACMADSVDDDFLARCPRLRVVSCVLKGYDNFDVAACARRGVSLTVLPDLLTAPTAELAVGLAIGLGRHLREADELVRQGKFAGWRPQLYGTGLAGGTVGIIGMGLLGQAVARRLSGFDTTIIYHDIRPLAAAAERELGLRRVGPRELMSESSLIFALAPLTAVTRGLIGAGELQEMRPGALLVNVGRGSVVDEDAIADALEAGLLGGYAADVFAMEDWLLPGHPARISKRLRRHPRTLWTPHLGSAVDSVRREMSMTAARQVEQALRGERPDHEVTGSAVAGSPDRRQD